jgi:hypothetical protein
VKALIDDGALLRILRIQSVILGIFGYQVGVDGMTLTKRRKYLYNEDKNSAKKCSYLSQITKPSSTRVGRVC